MLLKDLDPVCLGVADSEARAKTEHSQPCRQLCSSLKLFTHLDNPQPALFPVSRPPGISRERSLMSPGLSLDPHSSPSNSVPGSPSNPPSPSSIKDVPLLRLDSSHIHFSPSLPHSHSSDDAMPAPPSDAGSSSSFPTFDSPGTHTQNSHQMKARERKQSNPLSQFRSTQSVRTAALSGQGMRRSNTAKTTSSTGYGGSKGKSRYSESAGDRDDDDVDLLNAGGSVGQGGRGESDGGYDEGWSTGLQGEEEAIGLLGGSAKVSVSYYAGITAGDADPLTSPPSRALRPPSARPSSANSPPPPAPPPRAAQPRPPKAPRTRPG